MTTPTSFAPLIGVDITYEEAREPAGDLVLVMAFPTVGMTCEVNDRDAFEEALCCYGALGGEETIGSYYVFACPPEMAEVMRVERMMEALRSRSRCAA